MAKRADKELERQRQATDLSDQIAAATAAQANKLSSSRDQLVAQINMASMKYKTVNGFMQVRNTFSEVAFGAVVADVEQLCCTIAQDMSTIAADLASTIEALDIMMLDETVLDGYMNEAFVLSVPTVEETVRELLMIGLLQNVGPSIDDIVSFREGTNAELAKLNEALAELAPADLTVVE